MWPMITVIVLDISICLLQPCDPTPLVIGDGEANDNGDCTSSVKPRYIHFNFFVSRAFMAGAASQAGDADSSRAPGLASGLQGSVNVHRGALLLVPQ